MTNDGDDGDEDMTVDDRLIIDGYKIKTTTSSII